MTKNKNIDADQSGKLIPICASRRKTGMFLCYEAVSVMKEYNVHRHIHSKHGANYTILSLEEKCQLT